MLALWCTSKARQGSVHWLTPRKASSGAADPRSTCSPWPAGEGSLSGGTAICTKAHGSPAPSAFGPTREGRGHPRPSGPTAGQGITASGYPATPLHSWAAALTSPPRRPASRRRSAPPPFPACAAVRLLALGFCLSSQDGGHNEPAPRRLALRWLWGGTVCEPSQCGQKSVARAGGRRGGGRPTVGRLCARRRRGARPARVGPSAARPPARPLAAGPRPSPAPPPPPAAAAMKLTDSVLRSFRVAKVFRENSDKINCFDFSPNGETVISSSDDDSIVLYDCQEGKWVRRWPWARARRRSVPPSFPPGAQRSPPPPSPAPAPPPSPGLFCSRCWEGRFHSEAAQETFNFLFKNDESDSIIILYAFGLLEKHFCIVCQTPPWPWPLNALSAHFGPST